MVWKLADEAYFILKCEYFLLKFDQQTSSFVYRKEGKGLTCDLSGSAIANRLNISTSLGSEHKKSFLWHIVTCDE